MAEDLSWKRQHYNFDIGQIVGIAADGSRTFQWKGGLRDGACDIVQANDIPENILAMPEGQWLEANVFVDIRTDQWGKVIEHKLAGINSAKATESPQATVEERANFWANLRKIDEDTPPALGR